MLSGAAGGCRHARSRREVACGPQLWIGFIPLMGRKNHAVTRVARAAVPAALAAAAIAVSGCTNSGSQDSADLVNGKQQFVEKCGSCHIAEPRGHQGRHRPEPRPGVRGLPRRGLGRRTSIRGVVLGQIAYPGRGFAMPADLVTGDDAEDVAAYVAATAGIPGKDAGSPRRGRQGRQRAAGEHGRRQALRRELRVVPHVHAGRHDGQRPGRSSIRRSSTPPRSTRRSPTARTRCRPSRARSRPADIKTIADFVAAQANK